MLRMTTYKKFARLGDELVTCVEAVKPNAKIVLVGI